ncbi:LysR substrate-binding domain-containing protein [Pseudoxanthomonas sp. SL93]|uniref:LysR family transcriptional regulator n=1 Tax=Pseudoxanthomonas sp. SL93 TaxID=2995142 RepID=UPI002270D461|nr:LysR family transcriptional regulator [Pseudoxanthomonas sp. SL93]WAC64882.1 LysR substrate-binding domain-containing protein [Pseudoxanthomonas sp. SL93]
MEKLAIHPWGLHDVDRIDALRIFIDVVDTGSFSGVARRRAIATSTVALAVSQLEEMLGGQLLARSTRRLTLTHEGALFLENARRIVADWDSSITGLREDGPLSGPLRVTATNDFGRSTIRPLLDAFQAKHPGVQVTLLLSDEAVNLIDKKIDLAFRSGPLPDSSLRARLLVRGYRHVCASPAYWDRAGRPAHPRDLEAHNCIVLDRPGAPLSLWPFREADKLFNIKVGGDRMASDGDIIRTWAMEGHGVVLKCSWDIADDLNARRLETVLDDFLFGPVDLYAVYPGGAPSRRLTALVDSVAASLGGAHAGESAAGTTRLT